MKSSVFLVCLCSSALLPGVLLGQNKVVVVRHGSTPEGDIIRARADAALLLKQAELTGEKAYAQRLDNLIKECDVVYKRFTTRNKMKKEALENKYDRSFDVIRFNQQLADIRSELEQKGIVQRTRIGDPTNEMNTLLEKFARQSIHASGISAMKTDLSTEQLDAIFLTDGSNTFSGKTGKTRLEGFKWPFMIQRKEFQEEREAFDSLCEQAINEINANNTPSPETICDLLKQVDAIDKKLDALPLSDSESVRAVETKWRKEAKAFIRELTRTLGNSSKLDAEKLSTYVFQGKTLGELIDHLDSKGLRFSHPSEQDANLYASIFFVMRYAYQDYEKSQGETSGNVNNAAGDPPPAPAPAPADSQRRIALEVFRLGGTVTLKPGKKAPKHMDPNTLPAGAFVIYGIDFGSNKRITNNDLALLTGMSTLKILVLGKTNISDAGLRHLDGLTGLERLACGSTPLTDNGLIPIGKLTSLRVLGLHHTKVTDKGMQHLRGLTNLETINLGGGTKVSDQAVKSVLPNCKIIRPK